MKTAVVRVSHGSPHQAIDNKENYVYYYYWQFGADDLAVACARYALRPNANHNLICGCKILSD